LFGVAFDIGTTTVAGMLVDVNDRKIIAAHPKQTRRPSLAPTSSPGLKPPLLPAGSKPWRR
jgi:hypothetical protein